MKKLLVTMLVLSLAIVNIADARIMPGSRSTTPAGKAIADATEDLKNAPLDEKEAALQDVVNSVRESDDLQALVPLEAKRAKLAAELVSAEADKKAKNINWLFGSDDYKAARDKVAGLKKELAEVNRQIAQSPTFKAIARGDRGLLRDAMVMIVTIAGTAAIERYFGGSEGYVGRAGTRVGEAWRNNAPLKLGGRVKLNDRSVTP
jgi:hypothetical protein